MHAGHHLFGMLDGNRVILLEPFDATPALQDIVSPRVEACGKRLSKHQRKKLTLVKSFRFMAFDLPCEVYDGAADDHFSSPIPYTEAFYQGKQGLEALEIITLH